MNMKRIEQGVIESSQDTSYLFLSETKILQIAKHLSERKWMPKYAHRFMKNDKLATIDSTMKKI